MKIRSFFVILLAVLAIGAALTAVALCAVGGSASPVLVASQERVNQKVASLMNAICAGDFQGADAQLYGGAGLGVDREPAEAIGKLLWDAFRGSLSYEIVDGYGVNEDVLTQKVRLTHLDLDAVAAPLREYAQTLLTQRVDETEDPAELYDENHDYRADVVMDVLYEAAQLALAQNSVMKTTEITLPMVWQDNSWQVKLDWNMMDQFEMFITNQTSIALEGVLTVKKSYWLSDSDIIAPKPNPACYGEATSASELGWLLEEAADLLEGQEMLFSVDTVVWEGSPIYYYFDETILVITWKQVIDQAMYTFSEVKIAHASQFRRFLADGEYGSDKQYVTSEMAQNVNAVVASSGDFYKFRRNGIVVYEGTVRRVEGKHVDTCFINEDGDLLFAYRGEIMDQATAEKFVEENKVRYSLTFGPVLVDDGELAYPSSYTLGEIDGVYSRAAICQMDDLHYLMVNLNEEGGYKRRATVAGFAQTLQSLGVRDAYTLDGGQTAVISMHGRAINRPDYGTQRAISDIIYFATALPEGGA